MPNMFKLVDRTTGESPKFVDVDKAICEHFAAPEHPERWFHDWYNTVMAWDVALGKDLPAQRSAILKIIAQARRDAQTAPGTEKGLAELYVQGLLTTLEIIDWLDCRYTTEAWYQPR